MIYIFTSIDGKSINQCKKIASENEKHVKIVFLEDYLLKPFEIKKNDIAYILSLSNDVVEIINVLKDKCYIINRDFLEKEFDKLYVQVKLNQLGILVPEILEINKVNDNSFPLMYKSKNQHDYAFTINNLDELNHAITKYKINFYLERKIVNKKEIKVYFIKDELFLYDNEKTIVDLNRLSNICKIIKNEFKLDMFSLDLFISNNEFIIIDLNPGVGMYNSKSAREKFVRCFQE